jgi:hypothetical protein
MKQATSAYEKKGKFYFKEYLSHSTEQLSDMQLKPNQFRDSLTPPKDQSGPTVNIPIHIGIFFPLYTNRHPQNPQKSI